VSSYFIMEEYMKIPEHVAIILDGNGRWAKAKGMPRTYGHAAGAKNVEVICKAADDIGIKYLTLYAFSTENWKRPSDEVSTLMKLLGTYLKKCMKLSVENNMRVRILGDPEGLPENLKKAIDQLEDLSKDFTGLNLQIAINYGSRDEITRAARKAMRDLLDAGKQPEDLTEEDLSSHMDTAGIPDPDFMIRTSGEERLSNYLLWQLAYSEFYFTKTPWPDFNADCLKEAVEEYDRRNRRFGGL
jgi:undecaprenyl diphosphate synthase